MKDMNFSNLDRAMRRARTNKIVGFFTRHGDEFDLEKYDKLDDISRLEFIAKTIEDIYPTYKAQFNKLEGRKPLDRQVRLPSDFNLPDMVESAIGIETTEKALEIFYSNRLAHICRDAQKRLVYDMISDANKRNEAYPSLMHNLRNKDKINRIVLNAHRYFVAEESGNTKGMQIIQRSLGKLGISIDEIETLRKSGYDVLSKAYINCMSIKDRAIAEEIDMLKQDDTQSYGIKRTKDKDGSKNTLFVIDVPCFGQMSVHIFDSRLVSELSDHKYRYPIYQKDNVLLMDGTSEYQEYFMYVNANNLVEALRGLKNRQDAHEIAVKAGLTKDEIAELYSKNEGTKGDAR